MFLDFLKPTHKRRDPIFSGNAHIGTVLKVFPKNRSHVTEPYLVKIIETSNEGFRTELVNSEKFSDPHTYFFRYDSAEWVDYHCDRFQIVKK